MRRAMGSALALALATTTLSVLAAAPAYASSKCGFERQTTFYGYFSATYHNCGSYPVRVKTALKFAPDNTACLIVSVGETRKIYSGWDYPTGVFSC
jgi:hypothetical protein